MKYAIKNRWAWINTPCWEGEIEDKGSDALNLRAAVLAAHGTRANLGGADLRGADLGGANLCGADLGDADLRDADLRDADLGGANLRDADLRDADLGGANLRGADLRGADLGGVGKVKTFRVFTGLYQYVCMAILAEDGTPWVRMGCLWKTVETWDKIGIRASNTGEFPDDGSERCEERVRAFEFTRAAALRLAELNQKTEA